MSVYTIKTTPSFDGYKEFMKKYREIIQIPLGGSKPIKKYRSNTLTTVLSVQEGDSLFSLPQRLIHASFCQDSPITSYGCICIYQSPTDGEEPYFCLVKKRDSVAYIDLLQGNYCMGQLFLLVKNIGQEERDRLLKYDFDTLWKDLKSEPATNFNRERFAQLRPHLENIFQLIPSDDPTGKSVWGFPKGRPIYTPQENASGVYESPLSCAFREMKEETLNLSIDNYQILLPDPICERYLGTNSKNYQTHYFAISVPQKSEIVLPEGEFTGIRTILSTEISEIAWIPLSHLDRYLQETRLELCKYILQSKQENCTFNPLWNTPVVLDDFVAEI